MNKSLKRLSISKSKVEKIGLAPGDKVDLFPMPGNFIVSRGIPASAVFSLLVHSDGRIQIPFRMLNHSGFKCGKRFFQTVTKRSTWKCIEISQ